MTTNATLQTSALLADESLSFVERRNELLKIVEIPVMRKAWFTLSHILADEGARIIDMGCGDGAMTYAMAAMHPELKFTGLDRDRNKIARARENFFLPNLEFKIGDAGSAIFEPGTADVIINSEILHAVYSGSAYSQRNVKDTLKTQLEMLKDGGVLYIRDYLRPPQDDFVLIEMPDIESESDDLQDLSEADLLVWFSEHARPQQDAACSGFFLEELPPHHDNTRLFRLPHKWAYEFVMRKGNREKWESELPVQYTFFTERDFRKELQELGARVNYLAPHYDEEYIKKNFEGKFRLFDDNGATLGDPVTSVIIVARKVAERQSLEIEERRPAPKAKSTIEIRAAQDAKTGELVDIARRNMDVAEILPYRVDDTGRLKICLHDGIPRSIGNAVARNGINLDGRRWSGHMIEAISVRSEALGVMEQQFDPPHTHRFATGALGLTPAQNAVLQKGPDYFPAPQYIDDRIDTYYLNIKKPGHTIHPPEGAICTGKFQERGVIREVDAQQILDAISVGLIPSARLELQILSLFQHLGIKAENWTSKQIAYQTSEITKKTKLKDILGMYGMEKGRFKDVQNPAGQLRPIHSIFVEEGQSQGNMIGLTAQDEDFIVHAEDTINTAVILPLTMDLKGDVHAGIQVKQMPVPQRHTGSAAIISAPSLNLPRELTNPTMVKKFIADHYGVLPEMVIKLGESYYEHIGMTPHRIHPYAVAVPPSKPADPNSMFMPFHQMRLLRSSLSKDTHFMVTIARAYRYLHADMKLDYSMKVSAIVKERFSNVDSAWPIPAEYQKAPTLALGAPEKPAIKPGIDMPAMKEAANAQNVTRLPGVRKKPEISLSEQFEREIEDFLADADIPAPRLDMS